jgi:undecaprenyl-diphosphatase
MAAYQTLSGAKLGGAKVAKAVIGFGARTDYRLMRRVNQWPAPRWLRIWMMASTRGGDGWLWWLLGAFVAVFGGHDRFWAILAASLAVGLGILLFRRLKRAIGRKRPCAMEPHCWANLLPPDQFSFPSGHTITAFAITLALSEFYPIMLPGLLFCAASVAASRILLGMHFLTDVLAGAAIGSAIGLGVADMALRLIA